MAVTGYDAYQSRTYFRNLDGLRCICITMVLWHHSLPRYNNDIILLNRGFLGVDFFFVLSGFLITTLLLRERSQFGNMSLIDFYKRRAIRILPIYFFVVTFISTYFIIIKSQTEFLEILPFYYIFLSNFLIDHIPTLGITWSLSMEEQYYLVWPLVLLICPVAWYIPVAVALIAANVAIASGITGLQPLGAGPLSFHMPASTYAPLVIGSLAAIILDRRRGFEVLDQLCKNHLTPLAGFAALAVLIETMPADLRGLPNLLIHSTMAFILVSLVVREQNVLTGVLASPIIARVGVVSYGIYLYHLIALHLIHGVIDPQQTVAVFVLYSALAYIIAEISFRTLEAWFRRFRPVTRRAIA